jgi:replicative DNA helicase
MSTIFEVEQVILGSLIESPGLIAKAFERVRPEDFSGPHQIIAECLEGMDAIGALVTPATLLTRLERAGLLVRVGGAGMIHTLVASMRYPAEAEVMLDVLETEALRRRATAVGTHLLQALDNPTIEPSEALARAAEEIAEIEQPASGDSTLSWPDGDVDPEPVWVIPGLLASDDRLMLTGGEGLGKTMLVRQLVAAVAVGLSPFGVGTFDPKPALHVDLENPRWITDAGWRLIRRGLGAGGIQIPGGTLSRLEPRHFDVGNSRDVAWLLKQIRVIEPALIAIGPVKNMHTEDPNDERGAVRVQHLLNRIRGETGAALILEGHAGYSDRETWRPRGSSSWLGWPEFGYGLKPITDRGYRAAELVAWRGARADGRKWPQVLVAGRPWPWVEGRPQ